MKRILSFVLALTLVLGMVFSLASCGKILNGKYSDALGITTYEFSGSKVTITYEILGFTKNIEGKYKVAENDEGEMTITFTFENSLLRSFTSLISEASLSFSINNSLV